MHKNSTYPPILACGVGPILACGVGLIAACCAWLVCSTGRVTANETPPVPLTVIEGTMHMFDASVDGIPQAAVFGTVQAGLINEDSQADVVYLRDGVPHVALNPATWDAIIQIPTFASDIAILASDREPQGDERYQEDYVLTVGAIGLTRWERRTRHDNFLWKELGDEGLWRDATLVGAANLDGEQGEDIFGLDAEGNRLLILLADGNEYAEEVIIDLPHPAFEALAVELDGVAPSEIAVLGTAGLTILGIDGTVWASYGDQSGGVAAVVGNDSQPTDRIVWIARDADNTTDVLCVVSRDGIVRDGLSLGNRGIVSAVAADLDDDGDDDLVLNQRAAYELILLKNEAGVLNLEEGTTQVLRFGPEGLALQNRTAPAIADLDNDGDADLLIPTQSDETIRMLLSSRVTEADQRPMLDGPVYFDYVPASDDDEVDTGFLRMQLYDGGQVPVDATHVEIVLFEKASLETPTAERPIEGHHLLLPVNEGPYYDSGSMQLDTPEPSIYFFLVRYVVINDHDRSLFEYPAATHAFTVESGTAPSGTPILTYLIDELGAAFHSNTEGDPERDEEGGVPASETLSTVLGVTPIKDFRKKREPVADV